MEITKETLELKLKKFQQDHESAVNMMTQYSVLSRKLEGAIEATQQLIKELTEPVKKETPVKK